MSEEGRKGSKEESKVSSVELLSFLRSLELAGWILTFKDG